MAKNINIVDGCVFIGSPIDVAVVANTVDGEATFHRVKLEVYVSMCKAGSLSDTQTFIYSAPVESDETVYFDVSDALLTVAATYDYEPVTENMTYPCIQFRLKAYDEFMVNGILSEEVNPVTYQNTIYALFGSATDLERYTNQKVAFSPTDFSQKPKIGEVCYVHSDYVYPTPSTTPLRLGSTFINGAAMNIVGLTGDLGLKTIGERIIYVTDQERIEFQFINGRGVVESISAESEESMQSSGEDEVDTISTPKRFAESGSLSVRKGDRSTTFKMSTGYITREWAAWWLDEFFSGDRFRRSIKQSCWIKLSGQWIPCYATIDEDISIYDRTKAEMVKIDFTVKLAIGGAVNL